MKIKTNRLDCLTENQKKLVYSIYKNPVTIAIGPAGTGKTFVPSNLAMKFLEEQKVRKVILCRPAVPGGGEQHGFLPGDLKKKLEPWLFPIVDSMSEAINSKTKVDLYIKNGTIVIAPFQYLRGRTFNDAFVLLDEAQNTTPDQMKLFITRIGENSKVVISGDISGGQSDLNGVSGLMDILNLIDGYEQLKEKVGIVSFTNSDCIRSEVCKLFLDAYTRRWPMN